MEKTLNILYIGQSCVYSRELEFQIHQIKKNIKIEFQHLEDISKLSLDKINEFKPQNIIIDFQFEQPSYSYLFKRYQQIFPKNYIKLFGVTPVVNEESIQNIKSKGINFVFAKTSEVDEIKFLASSILYCHDRNMIDKKQFAIAKSDAEAKVELINYIRKFSMKNFTLFNNGQLFDKKINILESKILDQLNFEKNQLGYEINFSKNPNYLYDIIIDNNFLNENDFKNAQETLDRQLQSIKNEEEREKKKNELYKKIILDEAKNKQAKFKNWRDKKRSFYSQDKKKNILVLNKNNLNIRLQKTKAQEEFNLIKKHSFDQLDLPYLVKLNPEYVFINLEKVENTTKDHNGNLQFKDKLFQYNFIATAKFLIELYQKKGVKANIIIYNDTDLDSELIDSLMNLTVGNVKFINNKLTESSLNAYFDEQYLIHKIQKKKELQNKKIVLNSTNKKEILKTKESKDFELYFEENEDLNKIKFLSKVDVDLISEFQIKITTHNELPYYEPLKIDFPFPLYITLIPNEELDSFNEKSKEKQYKGIINCLNTELRDKIRGYVINCIQQYKSII